MEDAIEHFMSDRNAKFELTEKLTMCKSIKNVKIACQMCRTFCYEIQKVFSGPITAITVQNFAYKFAIFSAWCWHRKLL